MAALYTRTDVAGGSGLPAGVNPPLAIDAAHDHSGLIIVITAAFMGFALVFFGIRVYFQITRLTMKSDDITLILGTVLLCAQSAVVFLQVHRGWGMSEDLIQDQDKISILKAVYVAELLYIVTLFLSKCSGALFYLRITPTGITFSVVWLLVILSAIWAIVSLLLLGIRCDMNNPWVDITLKCSKMLPRWKAIAAIDCAIELAISSISIFLVTRMQRKVSQKAIIVAVLSARLLTIIPSILHVHFLKKQFDSSNPYLDGSYATICAQVQLAYSLVSNTIPCLKSFMAAYQGEGDTLSYRAQVSDTSGHQQQQNQQPTGPQTEFNDKSNNNDNNNDSHGSNNSSNNTSYINYSRLTNNRTSTQKDSYGLPKIKISPTVPNTDIEEWAKPAIPERSKARGYYNYSTPTSNTNMMSTGDHGPASESSGAGKEWSRPSTQSHDSGWKLLNEVEEGQASS